MARKAIDVHTHVYLPRYRDLLLERTSLPRIVKADDALRLVILPGEDADETTASGRPIGGEYFSPERKLAYMDAHDIDISVLSLANPWLEFLEPGEAPAAATVLNEDLEGWCEQSGGRFYGFGVLPISAPNACAEEVERIAKLPHLRGIILGATGLGSGLHDPRLIPVWERLEALNLTAFIHPHHGVGDDLFADTGHTLKLALGFPFETTVALARLILAGTFDRFPDLSILAAHAGGTLPFLAGRIDGAAKTDAVSFNLKAPPSSYLKKIFVDAITYSPETLACAGAMTGWDKLMFGTDHPFFRPDLPDHLLDAGPWSSPCDNQAVIDQLKEDRAAAIYRDNAVRQLRL
ncbi:MAG: amidohydrolase family protein [Devosia sp.]